MKNIKKIVALVLSLVTVLAIAAPALATSTMYVTVPQGPGNTVNVRKTASGTAAIVTTLTYGSFVNAEPAGSGWYKVIEVYDPVVRDMPTGYIMSQYLVSSIPTDCYWIVRYGTSAIKLTSSYNEKCKALQHDLNIALDLSLTEDGYCGAQTVAAIRQFQDEYSMDVDGIAGNKTKEYLYKVTPH